MGCSIVAQYFYSLVMEEAFSGTQEKGGDTMDRNRGTG